MPSIERRALTCGLEDLSMSSLSPGSTPFQGFAASSSRSSSPEEIPIRGEIQEHEARGVERSEEFPDRFLPGPGRNPNELQDMP